MNDIASLPAVATVAFIRRLLQGLRGKNKSSYEDITTAIKYLDAIEVELRK